MALARELVAASAVASLAVAARQYYWLRGVTYRREVVPARQELAVKLAFYFSVVGLLDALLRRCVTSLRRWRALLLAPIASWALLGPCWPRSCTRDDRGFDPAAQRWGIWRFLAQRLFRKTQIVLSEEWRKLAPEQVARWTEHHEAPYLIGMHPHGVLPFGGIINGLTWLGGGVTGTTASGAKDVPKPKSPGSGLHQEFFPHVSLRAAVASGVFVVPLFYEMYTRLGCFECTKPFMRELLRRGRTVAVYPGGAAESRYACPGHYVCYVRRRKGFIRLALEERLDILPLWTFGDEAILPQLRWEKTEDEGAVSWVQRVLKETTGLLFPLVPGGLPRFPPLTTVVGLPVSLKDLWPEEVGGQVSHAAVDEAHRRYIEGHRQMFDVNKALVPGDHGDAEIEFI